MKTLLVLAASEYQLDAIKAARRMGLRLVTVDNRPSNPGHQLADATYNVSTTDPIACLEIAHREKVDGVIAPCTDVSVPTQALIAAKLQLPGPTPRAASICCDKVAFRQFQQEQHLPHPRFVVDNNRDRVDIKGLFQHTRDSFAADGIAIAGTNSSWVIKPDKSSGSKGIFILRSYEEWQQRIDESRSYSPTGTVLMEEFLPGFQGTVEGIVQGGKIAWMTLLDRQTATPPFVVTRGHRLPSTLSAEQIAAVRAELNRLWSILEYRDGPFDCDFVLAPHGVVILEATPRLGGNGITRLIGYAYQYNLAEYAVKQAVGEHVALPTSEVPTPSAVVLLGTEQNGKLCLNERELTALRNEPWVHALELDVAPGCKVEAFKNGRCRVGVAYLSADSRKQLDARIDEVNRRLAVGVEAVGDSAKSIERAAS